MPGRPYEILLPGGPVVQGIGARGPSSPVAEPQTYAQALAAIDNATAGFDGQSWAPVAVAGLALPAPMMVPYSALTANCTVTWVGTPTNLSLPATADSAPNGTANAYLAALQSSSSGELLWADLLDGSASLLFTVAPGGVCPLAEAGLYPIPADVLDSPIAISIADTSGGVAFLSKFPSVEREWVIENTVSSPTWVVEYATECDSGFYAAIDAYDGTTDLVSPFTGACLYGVTFSETGLPSGTAWSVTFNGTAVASINSTVLFDTPNATVSFTVAASGFNAVPASGTLKVVGANVTVPVKFSERRAVHAVTFSASGLAPGASWEVSFRGGPYVNTTAASVTYYEPNGNYTFTALAHGYIASPESGLVTVSGAAVSQPIIFTLIPVTTVVFLETGLPVGATWWLWVLGNGSFWFGSSNGNSVSFELPNGNYTFEWVGSEVAGLAASPASGSFVANGSAVTIPVTFALLPGFYPVVFHETGLPANSGFNIWVPQDFEALDFHGANGTTTVYLPNGSYSFVVEQVYGFAAEPQNGSGTINGTGANWTIGFQPAEMYVTTFTEDGLPSGTPWWAEMDNVLVESWSTSLEFFTANGSFSFEVGAWLTGAVPVPGDGTVDVNGSSVAQAIHFRIPYTVTFLESGLPAALLDSHPWLVELNGSAVVVLATNTTSFSLRNGSYPYLVWGPGGYRVTGVAPSGTLQVSGTNLVVHVHFEKGRTLALTFAGKGLGTGSFSVEVGGLLLSSSNGSAVHLFNLTPGNYTWAVVAPLVNQTITAKVGGKTIPLNGTLDLARSTTIVLTFVYPYPVTFWETGLPSGGSWSVTVKGVTRTNATGDPITFALPNGTYRYKVGAEKGYRSYGSPPKAEVHGAAWTVAVTFVPKGRSAPPLAIGMSAPIESNPATGLYYAQITLLPSAGVTTGLFGLSFTTATGTTIAAGAAPRACHAGSAFTVTNCGDPASGAWYAVLWYVSNGTVANVYSGGNWTGPPVAVTSAMDLDLVSGASYAGSSDSLRVFPTTPEVVSGSSGKF